MAFEFGCAATTANTGLTNCRPEYGRIIGHILCPEGTEIATETLAKTLATWTTLFQEDSDARAYPLPKYFTYVPTNEDDVYETGDDAQQEFVRPGTKSGTKGTWAKLPMCYITKLMTLNNRKWFGYTVTSNGFILGKSIDGVKFLPVEKFVRKETTKEPTGDETWKSPLHIYDVDPLEMNNFGVAVNPKAFQAKTLLDSGLEDVTVAVSAITATGFTATFTTDCDGEGVPGLVVADMIFETDADVEVVLSGATESTTTVGQYAVTYSSQSAGTYAFNLRTPANMTTEGYESKGEAAAVIST